ncbi:rab-3A-interacting protein-like isoform X5 [Sinocyclocheilus anshuiensis]|uniref:rab-3A-interacting protein-like isoform X5 n=1 Tax=Sinocyclocheilus anshuiensis TaxID=1608454 RepID=UPI0007B9304F|nr:PREDICTED: rab-3A-interacting protein-like isoform X5 [Sinocyclocheilus anshuiensis]
MKIFAAMASEPLEGFHEVNLASPTTPDLHGVIDPSPPKHNAPPSTLYRTHALTSSQNAPNALRADQLPTQPVYSTPRHLGTEDTLNGSGNDPAVDGNVPSADGEDVLGLSADSLSRLRSPSVMEVREKGYEKLKEELAKAQWEAHKMVHEANLKQATAEKQLKEALGKIDVLQAEVAALKTLVLSTSPTSPCKEMPPGPKAAFKKGHARNKSTSSAMLGSQQEVAVTQPIVRECKEIDSLLFNEFKVWKEEPILERSCSFLERIYREDIHPCLTFSKSELGSAILEAVEQNTLSVEPVGFQPLPVVKASAVECGGPKMAQTLVKCALCGQTKTCKHRIKFGDSSNYYYVSPFCRYRITSVCNFFTYIRYILQGLVKQQDAEQMFWEVMQLRKEMSNAKLGYYKDEL